MCILQEIVVNPYTNYTYNLRIVYKSMKAHTDRTRFGNATRISSFQKRIKPSTDKNFTRYADQIAKIA
jgi:hypothetical protein